MSLLDFLGAGKSISQAQDAANQIVKQIAPIMQDAENRAGGIMESLLDRIDGAEVTATFVIKLKSIPKATPVE